MLRNNKEKSITAFYLKIKINVQHLKHYIQYNICYDIQYKIYNKCVYIWFCLYPHGIDLNPSINFRFE